MIDNKSKRNAIILLLIVGTVCLDAVLKDKSLVLYGFSFANFFVICYDSYVRRRFEGDWKHKLSVILEMLILCIVIDVIFYFLFRYV